MCVLHVVTNQQKNEFCQNGAQDFIAQNLTNYCASAGSYFADHGSDRKIGQLCTMVPVVVIPNISSSGASGSAHLDESTLMILLLALILLAFTVRLFPGT